ncbi:MAG: hypothetical protein JRH10_03080 [Deltaproteobacteria bacterium]|nr:hypothetical protein [Deltaproteobacteria bacterium]MBW2447850.1 hypothetical protein [Deltaproteobacteria bacterium]
MTEGAAPEAAGPQKPSLAKRLLPWLITVACFAFLYFRMVGPAAAKGMTVAGYLGEVFARVSWSQWLALMIPYSILFFLVDSLVVWRVINWFNVRIAYTDILPVRASTYVLSILNEQLGKGAMAVYLNRREGVPGWQLGSSMLLIMICEIYYLCAWANLGAALQWDSLPPVFHALPTVGAVLLVAFAIGYAYFRGAFLANSKLRDAPLLSSFRQAKLHHYLTVIVLRSPALIVAVFVYTHALRLFGVETSYLQMLGFLPVIFFGAAVPGPFRAVAITMWTELFPENPVEMAAFGLVQHNFFILFNAAIGLVFMRRANREIFGASTK